MTRWEQKGRPGAQCLLEGVGNETPTHTYAPGHMLLRQSALDYFSSTGSMKLPPPPPPELLLGRLSNQMVC